MKIYGTSLMKGHQLGRPLHVAS